MLARTQRKFLSLLVVAVVQPHRGLTLAVVVVLAGCDQSRQSLRRELPTQSLLAQAEHRQTV
jgi:hypothetical protein